MGAGLAHFFIGQSRKINQHWLTQSSVCHEEAFRYLLQAEYKRYQRTGQGYHILLVYRGERQDQVLPMHSSSATVVLDALSQGLRETDYIGWYREGHIIGGVLTVSEPDSITEAHSRIHRRVTETLHNKLGWEESQYFHIRLCRQHELQGFEPAAQVMTLEREHS